MHGIEGVEMKLVYFSILDRTQNSLANFMFWSHLTKLDKVDAKFCTNAWYAGY
jgi:hypothetical protein